MRKKTLVIVLIAIAILWLANPAMAAPAITVDGDLSDWGLSSLQTGDWSQDMTWLPDHGIWFVVGDNHNPAHSVNPAGVHIRGTKENYMTFNEEKRRLKGTNDWYSMPYGGELYDIEAMYFTQDSS